MHNRMRVACLAVAISVVWVPAVSAQATLDIRNLLTPDQLAAAGQTKDKLRDLRSQMRQILAPSGQP